MGGVTIAHHQPISTEISSEENFSSGIKIDSMNSTVDEEQLNKLLTPSEQWPDDLPIEDLTGEVQDLMMRDSINSWLQPWTGGENAACLTAFDTQLYAQSIQFEDLFGQDQLNFAQDMRQTAFYDELTFAFDDTSLETSTPTSSASSISGNSAQISPVVQPVNDALIEQLNQEVIVEKLIDLNSSEQIEVTEESIEVNDLPTEYSTEVGLKRRRDSTSSEGSSDDSSSSSDSDSEEDENVIPTTVANMNNRRQINYSSSSDSESDSEPSQIRHSRASSPLSNPYIYMHKRQIEETVLDRITNNLSPEKLPGILSILASEKHNSQQEDEVEIDLSCLAREQLIRVLSYVDACILEQSGGPAVNVNHYISGKPAKKGPRTRPSLQVQDEESRMSRQSRSRNRKPAKPRTKTRAELTEEIDADSSSSSESEDGDNIKRSNTKNRSNHGPVSMASLSKNANVNESNKARGVRRKLGKANSKTRVRRKGGDDDDVASSVTVIQDPDSIASSRPKRRAAVHKRRLLEDMLAPSDNEADDDSEDSVLVVYSDEQMDLGVVDNQTIMHQTLAPVQLISEQITTTTSVAEVGNNEDTDEEIDIMC